MKRKYRFKCEVNLPGFYDDDIYSIQASKTPNKRRTSSNYKIPTSLIEDYDQKVALVVQRQQKLQDQKFSKAKLQVTQLTKKQLIEKLIKQMQEHLSEKEKEIFIEEPQEEPFESKVKRNHRKSIFYDDQSKMHMLQTMRDRFELQEKQQLKKQILSQVQVEPFSPIKLVRKRSNLEQKLYEQQMMEYHNQENQKLQRVRNSVDKELIRLGLQKESRSQEFRTRNVSSITHFSTLNQSHIQPSYNQVFRKIKDKLSNIEAIKDNQIGQVIQTCQQELQSLSQLEMDLQKKKKTQFRQFKVIQNKLDSVGYYGFQKGTKIQ